MKKIVFIVGSTASGKSLFVHKLISTFFPCASILSLDSMQVYSNLNIGTAKPTEDERIQFKYEMIDIASPTEHFNVKSYVELASVCLERMNEPIFAVGGTGLYMDALKYGLFDEVDDGGRSRAMLCLRLETEGLDSLYSTLRNVDIDTANSIDRFNSRRVLRALEVFYKMNVKFSDIKKLRKPITEIETKTFAISVERPKLYYNINKRVESMFEQGLLDEVQGLIGLGLNNHHTAMQGIGYKECFDYLTSNNNDKPALIELIKQRTRNFSKRQLTWFKKSNPIWIEDNTDSLLRVANEVKLFYNAS